MSKQTPRPWTKRSLQAGFQRRTLGFIIDGADETIVATCEAKHVKSFTHARALEVVEANASLIELAPEMASLLRRYRDECLRCQGTGVYRVKEGGRGNKSKFIESTCDLCEDVRRLLAQLEPTR